MALTTSIIHNNAKPKESAFTLDDAEGLYLLVEPDGTLTWHLKYTFGGNDTEVELGVYPEVSLANARKKRTTALRLLSQGIDPQTTRETAATDTAEIASETEEKELLHGETHQLIAYRLNKQKMPIIVSPTNRKWMDETANRFAYRCMPMLLANQSGWLILSGMTSVWHGTANKALKRLPSMSCPGDKPSPAVSVFGSGILTFTLPYLFRTPPGFNLIAQGPVNSPKDGISALSGIIETDWAEATFTMNWKFTRPHHTVTFEMGEPICMVVPQRRYEVESFVPVIRDITSDAELHSDYALWAESRSKFNEDLRLNESSARKAGWQKHYAQGKTVSNKRSTAHQNKITLREFVDETGMDIKKATTTTEPT